MSAMQSVPQRDAAPVVLDLVAVIVREQGWLGEIDGATGDGDHGVNMGKGFRLAGQKLAGREFVFGEGLETLGDTLLSDIGGSMGPLYGTFFTEMADVIADGAPVDATRFAAMLRAGIASILDVGGAKEGDKTLVDVLLPAERAFLAAHPSGFASALKAMSDEAVRALEATRGMIARIGRASRLGERSRGSLDAGAASCKLILCALADGLVARLGPEAQSPGP